MTGGKEEVRGGEKCKISMETLLGAEANTLMMLASLYVMEPGTACCELFQLCTIYAGQRSFFTCT